MITTRHFVWRALFEYGKTPRGKANFYVLLFGSAATIFCAFFIIRRQPNTSHPILDSCLTLAATLLAVGVVEVSIKVFEVLAREPYRDKFTAFFGKSAATGEYKAVFAQAKLVGKLEYPHPATLVEHAYPKGIMHTICYEEVPPIGALDRVFRSFGGSLDICLDEYHREGKPIPRTGLLSIGLGFNNVTTALSFECKRLFEIKYGPLLTTDRNPGSPEEDGTRTDDFVINQRQKNGEPKEIHPSNIVGPGEDYALIARILKGGQPFIVCAGRSAYGTASALEYLAESWLTLFEQYETDEINRKHMVALLVHPRERREKGEIREVYFAAPGEDTQCRILKESQLQTR